tara:strand:+ start:4648 stop:4815 length:168 start_codon:yes stop_codon:yes gene_type:complete
MYEVLKSFYVKVQESLKDDEILFNIINEAELEDISNEDKERLILELNLTEYREND